MRKWWRLWAKSLGEKVGSDDDSDKIAIIRTFWWQSLINISEPTRRRGI